MPRKGSKKPQETVRQCANIRSKKHPDARCPLAATQGEFCARHSKKPTRFQEQTTVTSPPTKKQLDSVGKLQRWWRRSVGLIRYRRQGPVTNCPEAAENQQDVYTMESTSTIPLMYRWSYVDTKKHFWIFDVRSIWMMRAHEQTTNPYTREEIPEYAMVTFQKRCTWLRKRKYCLVHTNDTAEMSAEQIWHQKVLDTTLKYDMLGYHTSLRWFEELNVQQLNLFYGELWELWFYRLQLSGQIKQQVVPNWNKADTLLFKWNPHEIRNRSDRVWWQKTVLDLLDRFVSSAELKEHKTLGALYGMTAFAIVSSRVRHHYPWLVEMQEDF